jgi:hypothetical protein
VAVANVAAEVNFDAINVEVVNQDFQGYVEVILTF